MKGNRASGEKISLTEGQQEAFTSLKEALSSAPALGIPDNRKPFTLFVNETDGYMMTVLTQKHGEHHNPLATIPLNWITLPWNVMTTTELLLVSKLTVKWPYSVYILLSMNKILQVTCSILAVLEAPTLHIVHAGPVNPSMMLPLPEEQKGEEGA